MGNSSSASRGTLSIVLDPPTSGRVAYTAGQPVSGSVYVQSTSDVSSRVNADACISGRERSRVRYTQTKHYTDSHGHRRSRHVTRYRNAERPIVRMAIHLGNVSTGVQAGTRYRFPFQITLPVDLPSTMRISETGGRGGHADISYKIEAELKGNQWFGKYRVESPIDIISAPLPAQSVPNFITPIVKDVKYCCCFHVGSIAMGAKVENTRVAKGETIAIDFACKNQSLRSVQQAEVKVEEVVHWTAGSERNTTSRAIARQTFRETEHWGKMTNGELEGLKIRSGNDATSFRGEMHSMLDIIHAAIRNRENRVLVNIDPSSLLSYQGALVQVNHRLSITVTTSGCCTGNPTIDIPMQIGNFLPKPEQQYPVVAGQLELPPIVTATVIPSALHLSPPTSAPLPSAPPAEWTGAVATPVAVVGAGAAAVGGAVWEAEGCESPPESPFNPLLGGNVGINSTKGHPSLQSLLTEIENAVSPLSVTRKHLDEDDWKHLVFYTLTPSEYAMIIKVVTIEFDQPDMAALIAPEVRDYTHEYVIAALEVVSDWQRISLLPKVLPLCVDLGENANKIKAGLTDWELVCAKKDFEEAMGGMV